jgi:hypothetical protein
MPAVNVNPLKLKIQKSGSESNSISELYSKTVGRKKS